MKKQTGITLIALIITIIVMLILVAVTINIAVNGGLFGKAKAATIQTEIAQIQEYLVLKKADIMAENNGSVPSTGYGIDSIDDLDGIPQSLVSKYNSKLIISDGTLYYKEDEVTNEEKGYFEAAGINKYQGGGTPVSSNPLEGETFVSPIYNSPGLVSLGAVAGDYDITFTEDSWEIPYEYNGEKVAQGTYTYSNNSIHLLGTMGGNALDETVPLYTIIENDEVIEYYFICSLGFYSQYGNTNFVVPFTGEFLDSESKKTAIFSIDQSTGYGLIGGTISPFGNICYCYDAAHDKFYWDIGSGTPVNDFSFAQDYSTVTIAGATYTRQ